MPYAKSLLTEEVLDSLRISLAGIVEKLRPEPSCDFCGSPEPMYVYYGTHMSTGEAIRNPRWCACFECSLAIDAHDWETITKRAVEYLIKKFPGFGIDTAWLSVEKALEEFHRYSIYEAYEPTDEDVKFARMLMDAIDDGGLWGFVSANLEYRVDHKKKTMTLQNPERLRIKYSKEGHTRTINVWKKIGYTVLP
jgi:hypothetical protein